MRAIAGQSGYLTSLVAPANVSTDVAISQASRDILVAAFPSSATRLNALLDQVLITVADGAAKSNSIVFGSSVAAAILAARSSDGSSTVVNYTPQSGPGYWQPTLPAYAPALLPNWANLVPFAMTSSSQFQPAGPPSLSSAEYAAAFTETYQLGSLNSSSRTADQTEIALFWADGAGTYTPPGHWQQIAMRLLEERGASPEFFAATMAKLTVALADAAVVSWNAKYRYEFWRPVTAIAAADTDGNAATSADSAWRPLIATPPFPEYTSGHSTFSGAAAEILSVLLGRNSAFTTTSDGLPGIARSFTSFEQAANEAGRSRIYGGIHFEFSNRDGLDSGRQLASHVLQRFASLEGNAANAAGETGSLTGLSGSGTNSSQTMLSGGGLLLGGPLGTTLSTPLTTSLATSATSTGIDRFAANPFADPSEAQASPNDDYFAQLAADVQDEQADEADEEALWSAVSLLD